MPEVAKESRLTDIVVGVAGSLVEDHNVAVEHHNSVEVEVAGSHHAVVLVQGSMTLRRTVKGLRRYRGMSKVIAEYLDEAAVYERLNDVFARDYPHKSNVAWVSRGIC